HAPGDRRLHLQHLHLQHHRHHQHRLRRSRLGVDPRVLRRAQGLQLCRRTRCWLERRRPGCRLQLRSHGCQLAQGLRHHRRARRLHWCCQRQQARRGALRWRVGHGRPLV
ncbi:hypothetical protein LTR16_009747, partial [Cryomyces antarcticus]